MNRTHYNRQFQTGLSMVEILVSVLILSIGLLGIAGLQGTSLTTTRSASLRTQAIILSQDIVESMHANRTKALDGDYSIAFNGLAPDPTVDCIAKECDPSELAAFDLFNWWEKIDPTNKKSVFPKGTGAIAIDANGMATVSIKWRDNVRQGVADPSKAVDEFTTFSITSML